MSMLSINHNQLAANTANNLNSHYSRLATSTQRLSSGLRINGAADDAAGLAVRELMRAQVSALQQGMRNVNDAISMIQTFDGALGIIDEKLIRMKELAEQAATGTYDSTQRLMIASEFQAMGDEIDRIARATDFNGVKLISGQDKLGNQIVNPWDKVTITGSDGRTYSASVTDRQTIAQGITGIGTANSSTALENQITDPSAIVGDHTITITNNNIAQIGNNFLAISVGYNNLTPGQTLNIRYDPASEVTAGSGGWWINGVEAFVGTPNRFVWMENGQQFSANIVNPDGTTANMAGPATGTWTFQADPSFTVTGGTLVDANGNPTTQPTYDPANNSLTFNVDIGGGNIISQTYTGVTITNNNPTISGFINAEIKISVKDTTPSTDPADDPDNPTSSSYKIPDDVVRIHFGDMADKKEDFYDVRMYDVTRKGLGLDNVKIETQDSAQEALVKINDAIEIKDKIRADYGALQNRFENTFTNLSVQAENIKSAESRLSDADIAQEMTQFVRNQILTQSAIAMLAQANSMPQMVTRLLGA